MASYNKGFVQVGLSVQIEGSVASTNISHKPKVSAYLSPPAQSPEPLWCINQFTFLKHYFFKFTSRFHNTFFFRNESRNATLRKPTYHVSR